MKKMEETVKKMIKIGYGLGLLSLAEAKKVAGKLKKEMGLNDKESMKLAHELMGSSQRAAKDVVGAARKNVEKALVSSGVVSKKDLNNLKKMLKRHVNSCKSCVKPSGVAKLKKEVDKHVAKVKKVLTPAKKKKAVRKKKVMKKKKR
jgi:polyhydroxyalkanoate synthesis regulator phasin